MYMQQEYGPVLRDSPERSVSQLVYQFDISRPQINWTRAQFNGLNRSNLLSKSQVNLSRKDFDHAPCLIPVTNGLRTLPNLPNLPHRTITVLRRTSGQKNINNNNNNRKFVITEDEGRSEIICLKVQKIYGASVAQ